MGLMDPATTPGSARPGRRRHAGADVAVGIHSAIRFAVDRAGLTLTFPRSRHRHRDRCRQGDGRPGGARDPLGHRHDRGRRRSILAARPLVWAGALMCAIAAYLVQSPVAALLAAWFPAPFDLNTSEGGEPAPAGLDPRASWRRPSPTASAAASSPATLGADAKPARGTWRQRASCSWRLGPSRA